MFILANPLTHNVSIGIGSIGSAGLATYVAISFHSPAGSPRIFDDPIALRIIRVADSDDGMKSKGRFSTLVDSTLIVQEGSWNIKANYNWSRLKAGLHVLNTNTLLRSLAGADTDLLKRSFVFAFARAREVFGLVRKARFGNKTPNFYDVFKSP